MKSQKINNKNELKNKAMWIQAENQCLWEKPIIGPGRAIIMTIKVLN